MTDGSPLGGTLARLNRAFAGRRWYLFGAQAVVAHGFVRATADVDVTVDCSDQERAVLLAALRAEGLVPRIAEADLAEFLAATSVLPLSCAGLPVDVVFAGSGLEELFFAEARSMDLGGLEVPVICLEHLLVAKVLAGRPRDDDDVRGLLAQHGGRVDRAVVLDLLGQLERAIDMSDLCNRFRSLDAGRG